MALADNRLTELGKWDPEILASELHALTDLSIDLSFEPEILGFDLEVVDRRPRGRRTYKKSERSDQDPGAGRRGGSVTQPGDLWICGEHRLICGDPLRETAYATLLGDEAAHVIFTDACKSAWLGELARKAGTRSPLNVACKLIASRLVPAAVIYMPVETQHLVDILNAARPIFGNLKDVIAVQLERDEPGLLYRSQQRLILVFSFGDMRRNDLRGEEYLQLPPNLWCCKPPGDQDEAIQQGQTEMGIDVVGHALQDSSNQGELVLDPFGGCGTTMLAAQKT